MVSAARHRGVVSRRIVIAAPGRIAVPNFEHMWEAREVLFRFGLRDITLRYRQTALGVVWVVLQPLLSAGIFSIVFGQVAKLPTGGVPYFLFSFAGMLVWNLFQSIVTRGTASLLANSALVSKVFFPRLLVPLSTIYSAVVDFAVSIVFLIILLFAYQVNPGWGIVLLPVWAALACMFASGFGFVLSPMMVRYRDVQYVVPFLLQLGLYASPIAYSTSAIPAKYRTLFEANPITWFLEEFRWSALGQPAPPTLHIVLSVVVSIGVFAGGAMIFEQMERTLADVI
jgi:lipopolysaccharide transport system permease protein